MITNKKPYDLLFRDAPDERDLLTVRQFQYNNTSYIFKKSRLFNNTNVAILLKLVSSYQKSQHRWSVETLGLSGNGGTKNIARANTKINPKPHALTTENRGSE